MAKVFYVKGYAPWGWVVGSGVYVDAVAKGDLAVRSQQQRVHDGSVLHVTL